MFDGLGCVGKVQVPTGLCSRADANTSAFPGPLPKPLWVQPWRRAGRGRLWDSGAEFLPGSSPGSLICSASHRPGLESC